MIIDLVAAAALLGGGTTLVLLGLVGVYLGQRSRQQPTTVNEGNEHGS